jgi:hypothetical protein
MVLFYFHVNKKDETLLKTRVGEFTLHENKIVPLDLHMYNKATQ